MLERGKGLTESERSLAELADRTFLKLWAYPNLHIDKRANGGTSGGQELCDLLVVCGNHVLIFSDKFNEWPRHPDPSVAWERWRRRAIDRSLKQVRGAERWIREHPSRIFLDARCTQQLPVPLPPPDKMHVHGIVVARGAGRACKDFFGEGSGSLIVMSADLENDRPLGKPAMPFAVGDINYPGFFVHVLDDGNLEVMLRELDTVTDFVRYLDRKAAFLRSGTPICAHGEEELLAVFLTSVNEKGENDITLNALKPVDKHAIMLEGGFYNDLRTNPAFRAKKEAERLSYGWDSLLNLTSENVLSGAVLSFPEMVEMRSPADHERGLRIMALQSRAQRTFLGHGVAGAFAEIKDRDRFFRLMFSTQDHLDSDVAFAFMILKNNKKTNPRKDYQKYRELRASMLYGYCLNTLMRFPNLKHVVGIATEGQGDEGTSEEILYGEQPDEWTEDLLNEADRLREAYELYQDETLTQNRFTVPVGHPAFRHLRPQPTIPYDYLSLAPPPQTPSGNRRQRRKAAAKFRKNNKR